MFVYGILLHWVLISPFEVCLLGIFDIVGFCEVLWVFQSLSHSCYAFGVSRVHMRVLWDPMLLRSWLIYFRYERWVTFLLGSPDHCLIPTIPSLVIWLSFIVLTWVDHHSFHFLIVFFCIPLPLSRSSFHFLSIPYLLIPLTILIPSSHHSHVSLMVWLLIFLSFRHRHFLWLPLGPWLMRFFYAFILYMRVWVWSLGIWA